MPTVAIIHAAEDALPARALAEKLRTAKLTVVLEKEPGDEQRRALKDAKVTIALWSPRSVGQQPLIEDAKFAGGKSTVVHATMQNAPTPGDFAKGSTVNLTGWRGEDDFPAWRQLAQFVTERAGVQPLPPPAPRPPSGFFQPGIVRDPQAGSAQGAQQQPRRQNAPSQPAQRAQPAPRQPAAASPRPQQAPRAPQQAPAQAGGGGGKGMLIGIIAFVVVAAGAAGGYFWWSQQQTAATTTAWDSVEQNDASAIRAFLDGDPGEYRDEAQAALASLEERSFEAASDADTIDAFEGFLNDFPDSQHALAARGRIAELQTMTPATTAPTETPTETAPDPDLVPPGATASDAGPAALTPPSEPDTSTPPEDAPTN